MPDTMPRDMNEWMRLMERKVRMLEGRSTPPWLMPDQMNDPYLMHTPRWLTRLQAATAVAPSTLTYLQYTSQYSPPRHDPMGIDGSEPGSMFRYQLVGSEHRFVCLRRGLYLIRANIQWNASGTGTRKYHMFANGAAAPILTTEAMNAGAGAGINQQLVGIMPLAENDWISFGVYQGGTATFNVVVGGTSGGAGYAGSELSIVPLGAYYYNIPQP